jgi:probable F420-dependent oxidoreductase
VRFFLYGTYIPADQLVAVARAAEACGFHGITIPDHVVYPHDTATAYPYAPDPKTGRTPWDEACDWPDPMVSAGAMLAATERLTVLTGIFVLPMRDPLLVAKAASTVAALSPGRFILGAGAGWLREEFEILGYDFDTRGPRSDEAIAALRALWTGERVSHGGRDVTMRPAPPVPIPIYVGGDARPALRRAALLADGILPPLNSQRRTAEHLETIAGLRAEHGRTGPFDYVAAAAGIGTPDGIAEIGALGVESVHVDPFALYVRRYGGRTLDARRAALERYADEVIAPLAGA